MQLAAEPDLIIFDCDGVLVDSEVLSCRCLSETLAEFGIALTPDEAGERFLGRSTAAITAHYRGEGRELAPDFLPRYKSHVLHAFEAALKPIEGIEAVLSACRVPSCVASSSDFDRVMLSLRVAGLARHFSSRVYTAQMVRRGKPAPDLFLHAAEQMQAAPSRTLVIEDSVSGVQAATAAGMTVWGFAGGSHYRGRDGEAILAAAGADRVFSKMADFWKDA